MAKRAAQIDEDDERSEEDKMIDRFSDRSRTWCVFSGDARIGKFFSMDGPGEPKFKTQVEATLKTDGSFRIVNSLDLREISVTKRGAKLTMGKAKPWKGSPAEWKAAQAAVK